MKKIFIALTLYCGVVFIVFGPALFPKANQLIFGDDIYHQYYFYRQFFNSFLNQGIFSWWNPYNFSGTPFIANPVVNIWYPLTWLFFFLPINVAYSWHIAIHLVITMTGMYVLSAKSKVQSVKLIEENKTEFNIAAWTAGLVFGLSGFFMARVWAGHVDVIAAASWMPWVVGAFWRVMDQRDQEDQKKWIVYTATLFALQLYAGYQTMAFFTVEAIGIVTLVYCFFVKSFRPVWRALLAGALGLGLAGLQLIPEQEFFQRSIRTFSFPYSWISYGSLSIENLKQLINPFYFGDQITYHGGLPNYAEHSLFVGKLTLVLVGFAVFIGIVRLLSEFIANGKSRTKANNFIRFDLLFPFVTYSLIAVFGLWMSLGKYAPIDLQYLLWKVIPMYHYLRIPPRHLVLFVFGMSVLAGVGLEELRSFKLLKRRTREILAAVIVTLVLLDLIPFAKHFVVLKNIPETTVDPNLVQTLTQDKEPYRLLQNFGVWIPPRESLDFDSTMKYRIFSATGYDPSILRNYYEFIDIVHGRGAGESILNQDVQVPFFDPNNQALDFLNIKYLLVPTAYDPLGGQSTSRFTLLRQDQNRQYRLYENKTVLPRFYFVPRVQEFPTRADIMKVFQDGNAHFSHTVYTTGLPMDTRPQSTCRGDEKGAVDIASYSPNKIVLGLNAPCNGFLSSSEVYYPGWQATIDGKRTEVFQGNLAFRTLFISVGQHNIVFFYQPWIFVIGISVSVLTGLGLLAFCLRKQKDKIQL